MKVILTGGGTGGHITPLLAVAEELKRLHPNIHITYVGERQGKFTYLTDGHAAIDEVKTIFSGKFRRYHGESLLRRVLDIKTNLLNMRDACYIGLGLIQSLFLLKKTKPDTVFLKGGYVGVPVGLAAAIYKIPFITHDSDAVPGLANRLVAKWATLHAVADSPNQYRYPKDKTRQVGVIVNKDYRPVPEEQKKRFKHGKGIPAEAPVLLVTGGSLGAQRINLAVKSHIQEILDIPDLHVIHQVGKGNAALYDGFSNQRLQVYEFLNPMHEFTGAADIVLTRAGANTLAELGVQGKACIVVPNELLTDGHQLKNAQLLEREESAIVLPEYRLADLLLPTVKELIKDAKKRNHLGRLLQQRTKQDAATTIANLLMESTGL